MKKRVLFIILLIAMFGSIQQVSAASISVTSSASTITSDGRVTFYVNIRGAAAWQLTGKGTGATSGCSLGDQGVGDSGTGKNTNKTLSVTCKATSIGQISFSVSGNITEESGKNSDVSGRKIVVVTAPREKDSNNYLKSLTVKDYDISPTFSKDTLEYSVTVPSTVDQITIDATSESGYASVTGTGEMEVEEGANNFEIVVRSETGVERTYKLVVNVKDENPVIVTIDGKDYTILKNVKNVENPELYEAKTVQIKDFDIPSFYSEVTGFTLVAVKDENGKSYFAIYDEEQNSYQLYNEQKSSQMRIYVMNPFEDLEGFSKTTLVLQDMSYSAFQVTEGSNFYLVYGMNVETGKKEYYVYDKANNTFQPYFDELVLKMKDKNKTYQYVILGSFGIILLLVFFLLLALFKKPSKKAVLKYMMDHKSEKISTPVVPQENKKVSKKENTTKKKEKEKKEEKAKDELESKDVEVKDAIQKMTDAEEMILEYEKTLVLSKSDLQKAKKEQEQQEENKTEMNRSENSKSKKKKKS